jgi:hypothetical protein
MIKKHLLHIGMPRSGTTWLWHNVLPALDESARISKKENDILFSTANIATYQKHFNQYQISANMNPNIWMLDTSIIQDLNNCTTHVSMTFRNPFDFANSFLNLINDGIKTQNSPTDFVDFLIESNSLSYATVWQRWSSNYYGKIKFFLFDDLISNSKKFCYDIYNFYELDTKLISSNVVNQKINVNKQCMTINFSKNQIDCINNEINNFSKLTNICLDHWIK